MLIRCPNCSKFNRLPLEIVNQQPICDSCKANLLTGPVDADQASFDEILQQSKLPIIVDFLGSMVWPVQNVRANFSGKRQKIWGEILHIKVDTEANPAIGQQYNIRSIPTLAIFKQGKEIERISGALPPQQLESLITKVL